MPSKAKSDAQTADGTLEERTDEDGHVTPHEDPEQRAADIDAQVAANRVANHRVGGNTVEPGQYEAVPVTDGVATS